MTLLLRILVLIPLGYVAACLAAGGFMMLAIYRMGDAAYPIDMLALGFAGLAAAYAGAIAALPAAVFIVLAEAFGWRSLLAWCLGGGVLGVLGRIAAQQADSAFAAGHPLRYVAAGLVFGAVYWLVAGRTSGAGIAKRRVHP